MPNVNLFCFFASYSVAFGLDVFRLRARTGWGHSPWCRWAAIGFGAAGLLAHTMYLLLRSSQTQQPPLLSSAHDWLLVLSWLAVLTHLFVSLLDAAIALGIIVWPVVLSLVTASHFLTTSTGPALNYQKNWKMLHASMLVLGTGSILLGFVLSLLYLWQHRRLKHRQMMTSGLTLPSLERLERYNRWAILTSVPLLTFGVASGFGLSMFLNSNGISEHLNASIWTDPVVLGGATMWLLMCGLFAWLLSGKRTPGRQVAWLTAWSCGFLLFMMVGLQVLTEAVQMPSLHGKSEIRNPVEEKSASPGNR